MTNGGAGDVVGDGGGADGDDGTDAGSVDDGESS